MVYWYFLSAFGDPYLTLPLACVIGLWLAATGRARSALVWGALFGCAMLMVGVTKFAYAGWGIELNAVHFTVISGHTMLSSAVYPMAFYLCARGLGARAGRWSARLGVLFAVLIGVSRVMIGAHSESEVVVGWLVGFALSAWLTRRLAGIEAKPVRSSWLALACMTTAVLCYGHPAPIQAWIADTAPQLARHL
jgi:membrane-associated phospholipid phosphatase